jgi:glycine cleavage system regulatory protein
VVFIVDDLGGWLVGLLADASRKKLTTLVLGSDQDRALRRAAEATVQQTADELSHAGSEQAVQLATAIRNAFKKPMTMAPLAGKATVLEALQAGIAEKLTVADEVSLTSTGQSTADALGVPATVLAEKLAGQLVWEIMVRGSGGGPLAPLADQLNHELTRLQGQRVEGMLAQFLDEVRDALARPGSDLAAAGRVLNEVNDPFVLEVHQPVQPDDPQPGLPALPEYVPRDHDVELWQVVRAAAKGSSRIAALVGGSSTGKTRACWEAVQGLRDQPGQWRLWHPIDPSRPEAALRELPTIGPRTVVWLNEAQFYLDVPDGGLGERVAAGLRELLRNPARAPILVLATLWPQFWDGLTIRPVGGADPHAQARDLLAGHDITVPAAFTAAQLQRLREARDTRLVQAATQAQDGQVIQFLAGAPELLARYRHAPPASAALIHAAMDARRLGMRIGLPHAFLAAAAPGYLTDTEWDALGDDWLEEALAYTAVPCKGVRGPLTRIRPRPARSGAPAPESQDGDEQPGDELASMVDMPLYRLADYLDQHGRHARKDRFPPAGFWAAAAGHAFPGDQAALGDAANARGLYRAAAQLQKNAAVHISHGAPYVLAALLDSLREAGAEEQVTALADRAAAHIPLDNLRAVATLLDSLREAGAEEQVTVLANRAAVHVPLDNPYPVAALLGSLRRAGAEEQVIKLLHRNPAACVPLDNLYAVAWLLDSLRAAGAEEQVTALAGRAAAHVPLDDPAAVAGLLGRLRDADAEEQVTVLADRAAAHVSLDDPAAVSRLLGSLRAAGAEEQITALLHRDPASHVSLDDPAAVSRLLGRLRDADAEEQVTILADRAAAHVPLDDPEGVARLLDSLRETHAEEQANALADRAAARIPLDEPEAVAGLLDGLLEAGATEQVTTLLRRDPARHVPLDNPRAVAGLLNGLREAGATEQVTTLLRRDPASHVPLDNPRAVAGLLTVLRDADAEEQVTVLADRAAAHVPLDDPEGVARLLDSLRGTGAEEQANALTGRLPGAGMFELFREQEGHLDVFRFGREADGSPARPWGWEDLV